MLTSAMPAEYGHATAGALIIVKKAGTNTLHGEGGELFKSTSMMHRRFFQRTTLAAGQPGQPALCSRCPISWSAGRSIIPKLYNGKNKTFFEVGGSYHIDSSSNAGSYSTPTPEMLAGNFSAYSNQLYDPNSTSGQLRGRQPVAHSVPRQHHSHQPVQHDVEQDHRQQPVQAAHGRASGSITNTGPNGNIVQSGTGNYFNFTNQFRVDHTLSNKMRMMLSYSTGNQHQPQNNANIVYAPYDQYQTLQYTIQSHAALSFTYTISPTLISETKVGIYRRTGNYDTLRRERLHVRDGQDGSQPSL